MTPTPIPPRLAEAFLRLSVRDPEWRDAVTGDLREELAGVVARRGRGAGRRWYWRQALPLAMRFALSRLVPSVAPARRRRLTIAEVEHTSVIGAGWLREFRHAWRALAQRPGLTAVVVVTLGVALAANAVVFNLADALYLRPFRFPEVNRLVLVVSDEVGSKPYIDRESVAPADFRDFARTATSVSDMAAADWWDPNLSGIDVPEQVPGFKVSAGYFELLGVTPLLGRTFTKAEERLEAHRKVVLSHAFWVRQFAADPAVLGRTVRLDGEPYEIVGVMPARFAIPFGASVWAPLAYDDATWAGRERGHLIAFARLAAGHTLGSAQTEFRDIAGRLAAEFPATNRQRPASVVGFSRGMGDEGVGPFVAIWQAAAALLLLVACANIANLLLARGTERQPEFAVRLALGAGRGRLVRQLLIEGLCLAAMGVSLGAALAGVAMHYTRNFLPANIVRFVPGYEFLGLDAAMLGAMALLGAAATVVFSLIPAVHLAGSATAASAFGAMRTATGPPGRQWLRSTLAGGQVALALALAVGTALILGAVDGATNGAVGFDKRGLATAQLTLPERPYESLERRRQFVDGVLERMRGLPGVTSVAAVSSLPYGGSSSSRPMTIEGAPADELKRDVSFQRVTPAYFATMRVPLLAGRGITDADREDAPPVAVVSRLLAEQYWPGASAVGRRFRLTSDGPWLTVVGVSGDVLQEWFSGRKEPTVYRPMRQDPPLSMALVVRTTAPPDALAGDMRRAVTAEDADQPVLKSQTMDEVINERLAGISYFATILMTMSGIALVLSLTGIYSLVAYLVARRTREIGVRIALGATAHQVQWLAAERALGIVVGGVTVGAVLAALLGRVMQSALFGLVTPDLMVVGGAVAAIAVVTMAAGYLPARRAAAQDPWQALRTE
ncbi:MAG TPA: ABC transporter permease [Vicinamibacterales bacterium]|nr:ABC transporter permease [Vicinamibacterales bacterium]